MRQSAPPSPAPAPDAAPQTTPVTTRVTVRTDDGTAITVKETKQVAAAIDKAIRDAAGGTDQTGKTVTVNPQIVIDPSGASQLKDIAGMGMGFVIALALGVPLVRAFGRRLAGPQQVIAGPDLTPQVRQLQESIDAMAIELERISEAQRFQAKLLSDRSGPDRTG